MDEAFLGTIQAFAFGFAPYGWAQCNGQILSVTTNSALFSLIGKTFGGDGISTFGLPDLQGRTIIGIGPLTPHTSAVSWGEKDGAQNNTLALTNLPVHKHAMVNGTGSPGTVKVTTTVTTLQSASTSNESDSGSNGLGTGGAMPSIYRESPSGADFVGGVVSTISGTTGSAGSTPPAFDIRNPFLGLNYCIATSGNYPSRP